jgi:hypothetical protein
MNSYDLSRMWFDFSFSNPDKIKPIHTAIYFFAIEHCNRLGWKKKFGFPTSMVLEATGIKSYSAYKKHFDEIVEFGFFTVHEYSKNQYSSNVIELSLKVKALDKALDKALIKHSSKQVQSTHQSSSSIDKQLTITPINNETINNNDVMENKLILFTSWWSLYNKKTGKEKTQAKWLKLSIEEINKCLDVVSDYVKSTPDKQFRKDPTTYLNGKHWNDEIIFKTTQQPQNPKQIDIIAELGLRPR